MKYYKAMTTKYDYFSKNEVAKYELLTERERNKRVPYISDCYFETVDIPAKATYKVMGRRFEKAIEVFKWYNTEIDKSMATPFKEWLRKHNIRYETSGAYTMTHFEIYTDTIGVKLINNAIDRIYGRG